MPVTLLGVCSSLPISDARFRLTIFDDDHDLPGRSARIVWHSKRPETK